MKRERLKEIPHSSFIFIWWHFPWALARTHARTNTRYFVCLTMCLSARDKKNESTKRKEQKCSFVGSFARTSARTNEVRRQLVRNEDQLFRTHHHFEKLTNINKCVHKMIVLWWKVQQVAIYPFWWVFRDMNAHRETDWWQKTSNRIQYKTKQSQSCRRVRRCWKLDLCCCWSNTQKQRPTNPRKSKNEQKTNDNKNNSKLWKTYQQGTNPNPHHAHTHTQSMQTKRDNNDDDNKTHCPCALKCVRSW